MHLAALVESRNHVCCRYRLSAFRSRLAEAGHDLDLFDLPHGIWKRCHIGSEATNADAVILQRKLLSAIEIALLRKRARRLIFDFDDAVWLRDSYSAKGFDSIRRQRRFRAILARCDLTVAGNAFLAEHARQTVPNCPVRIVPTCVDVGRYSPANHERNKGEADLVWIGSSSTLKGLEAIRSMLEMIGASNPGIRLKLICDRFLQLKSLPVISCPWTEAGESADIASADIGISWIPDDLWSRGKCGLKVLQYMAGGLPVVANPVGVQQEMIRHGETGFLARTEAEWIEAIRCLAADPDLRRRMGAAGRRLVEEKYSVAAGAELWLAIVKELESQRISA